MDVVAAKDSSPTAGDEQDSPTKSSHELQVSELEILGPSDPKVRLTLAIPFSDSRKFLI